MMEGPDGHTKDSGLISKGHRKPVLVSIRDVITFTFSKDPSGCRLRMVRDPAILEVDRSERTHGIKRL